MHMMHRPKHREGQLNMMPTPVVVYSIDTHEAASYARKQGISGACFMCSPDGLWGMRDGTLILAGSAPDALQAVEVAMAQGFTVYRGKL